MNNAKAMKPVGLAIKDFYAGDLSAEVKIYRDDGTVSNLAISAFFRGATDFQIDKVLLDHCRGRVLDLGARAGIHSLYLQKKGFDIQAMEVSPEACKVMKQRGLKNVICTSFTELKPDSFDTLLILGRGITMVGTLDGLAKFLTDARRLVNTGGQILLDSLDVNKTADPQDIAYYKANKRVGRYIGEFRHYMEYKGERSPVISLLHVDPATLASCAAKTGWSFENLLQEKDGNYAARLVKKIAENEITGKTSICGLLGDPVEHTMSPLMHNAAFRDLGLDFVYVPFRVKSEHLAEAVAGLRALNVRGFNVTIPHKVSIIPLLDSVDPLAAKIGAVNTVVNVDGQLHGFNTDAEGFYRALEEHGLKPEGKKVAVLGAGGAGRAIAYVLTEKGARVTIFNRREHLTLAQNIADMINKDLVRGLRKPVKVLALESLSKSLPGIDMLVNTTNVGMWPGSEDTLVPAALLKDIPVVFDVVYNPVETRLLKEAAQAGAKTIGGAVMLAWQGALAFEKWTGRPAPLDLMRHEILKALGMK